MGRRHRQRDRLRAPTVSYADDEAGALELRGSLSAASRREYAQVRSAAAVREDAWQRAVEFLFERLAVRWTVGGVPLEGQRELLARYRVATSDERSAVRDALRRHCAEHFPDLEAP